MAEPALNRQSHGDWYRTITGEPPRAALVDPVLESRLRLVARTSDGELSQHIQWILKCIEDDL